MYRLSGITFILLCVFTFSRGQAQKSVEQGLDLKMQSIVNVASLTAVGDLEKLKPALVQALDQGMTVNEIKEVLIHLYAYCGFPRSLRGIQTLMSVLEERKSKGIVDKTGRFASQITDSRSKYERGKANLEKLTGAPESANPKGYAAFAPEIEVFLKEHLFADIFDRDLLTFAERELVTVSVNASIGGVGPMVSSHMGHTLTSGITPAQLQHLVKLVEINAGKEKAAEAQVILTSVLRAKNLTLD